MTPLPTLGGNNGFATGANNLQQIVGWAENTIHDGTCVSPQVLQFEPVLYGPGVGQIQQLPNYPGDPDGAATAINDNGQVVGISGLCDVAVGAFSAEHALLWQNGKVTDLGNLGGKGWNTPMAINSRGDVVGFSDLADDVTNGVLNANFHAFLWTKAAGKMIDIGVLPGDSLSEALDINDQEEIVGVSFPSTHAFIYENGRMTDLNDLIPSGSPLLLLAANGINNRGEITGQACVIAEGGCPAGADTPAFLAFPAYSRDGGTGSWSAAASFTAAANVAPPENVTVPDDIRQEIMRRLAFGHFEPERTKP
jgi:probable HAF family extracellular repeat protein